MAKLDTLQTIEIAEGVEIRLRVAGPAVRGLALLLDMVFKLGAILAFLILLSIFGIGLSSVDGELGGQVTGGLLMLFYFVLEWFYYIIFEVSKWGATPGKRIMGLRVVQTSGAAVRLPQSLLRNLLRPIDAMPFVVYAVGFISCLMTKRFQRLGDLVAGTVVVYTDHDATRARPKVKGQPDVANLYSPIPPPCPVSREEQEAIVNFADRLEDWSDPRQQELANHAELLTHATGERGVQKLLSIAQWIRTAR